MAVPLEVVRASNANLKSLKPGLVGVFVGGTAGLGEAALRAFAKHTQSPKIYLVGRNESAALSITEDVKKLNPDGAVHFIKADTSLLKNVDTACKEIQAREDKVNVLFMTTGYLTLSGRLETSEGLDKKYSLNYYSRFRFVHNLLPQLTAASSEPNSLSRVVSVLSAGSEGKIIEDDLELKHNFSLRNCLSHAVVANDFACEELAKTNTGTAFVHMYPGAVNTSLFERHGMLWKVLGSAAAFLFRPFMVPLAESAERNLYHATGSPFAPRSGKSDSSATGSDGVQGSGAYLLNWNGKPIGDQKILTALREKGMGPRLWEHTLEVFERTAN